MAYTNPQNVRDLLGVDLDSASDEVLEKFIGYAQNYIQKLIQIRVIDGKLSGSIDGSNNTFSTKYAFWADVSGDTSITTEDFTVWGWKEDDDPFSRVELQVSTFDPLRGKVVLSSVPNPDNYEKLTMDYSYYTRAIDWELLSLATAWKAAEIWVKREEFLIPESWSLGGKRHTQRQPWKYFEREVTQIIDKLRALPMDKVTYKKLVFRPRGPEGPEVDTSSSKEIRQKGKYTKPIEAGEYVH